MTFLTLEIWKKTLNQLFIAIASDKKIFLLIRKSINSSIQNYNFID